MKEFFRTLFTSDQKISYGDFKSWRVKSLPGDKESAEFFCINPLHPDKDLDHEKKEWYKEYVGRRADINVTSFQNFMFEMDSTSLTNQLRILEGCGIPWTSIVYSGSKSYHAILSLFEPLDVPAHEQASIDYYKTIWRSLAAKINAYAQKLEIGENVIDPSSINPSRLSRYPNGKGEGRKTQFLIQLSTTIGPEEFASLLDSCPIVKPKVTRKLEEFDGDAAKSVSQFVDMCSQGLYLSLKYTEWNREGNYPGLYRLVMWALDETGVTKEVFLEFAAANIFTKFEEIGYPKQKWRSAIDDAYANKFGAGRY